MTFGVIRFFKRNKNDLKMLKTFYNSLEEEKTTFLSSWNTITNAKFMLISEYEGNIIAISGVTHKDNSFSCVKKQYQGRGIGKSLAARKLKYCTKIGVKKIRAASFNPISQHLAEKTGYKELLRIDKTVYYELPLLKVSKITLPIRRIGYLLFGFWMNLKLAVTKKTYKGIDFLKG